MPRKGIERGRVQEPFARRGQLVRMRNLADIGRMRQKCHGRYRSLPAADLTTCG